MTGLEELRSTTEIVADGFAAHLPAYACRVYVDLREVVDAAGAPWSRLAGRLAGEAVPSLTAALLDLILEPEHERVRTALTTALASAQSGPGQIAAAAAVLGGLDFDGLRLDGLTRQALVGAGLPNDELDRAVGIVRALANGDPALAELGDAAVRGWFADPRIRTGLRVNTWEGVEYVEREAWLLWISVIAEAPGPSGGQASLAQLEALAQVAADAGYRVDRLLAALSIRRPASRPGRGRGGASARAFRGPASPRDGGAG
jgi:hypothetical protein